MLGAIRLTMALMTAVLLGGWGCASRGSERGSELHDGSGAAVQAPGDHGAAKPKPVPVLWRYRTASPLSGPPIVSSAGQIVFSTLEGYVHSLALNGELLWNYTTVGSPLGSPAVDDRGRVLVVTQAGHIHAIQSDGTTAFNYRVPVNITSPGTWSPRGFLAFAGMDNHLWAYSPRAGLLWRAPLPAAMTVAPTVMTDGELLLTTQGGGVWRMRGRRLVERLPDSATTGPGVAAATGAARVCRQPLLDHLLLQGPIAGELRAGDRIVVWSQAGQFAALTPENLALACP